ncbi:hypothetical protein PLCT1_00702 [Planctomycetaceae bacterium]|nr:hypothetical protein PLCT1_00702 [Planctomycetaceae bacterium]
MPEPHMRRYEPDIAEFSELQRAYLWRAMLYGAPALVTILFTLLIMLVWIVNQSTSTTPLGGWVYFLLSLPAFLGAGFQIVLLWIERPAISVDAVAVEVGEGVLRFVNDEAGTVEEVRWKENKALNITRKNDCVEITFPSGRRSRVHWFAYSEREQLLKDLMQLKETKSEEAKPESKPTEAATKTEDTAAKNAKSAKTSTRARKKSDEEE